MSQQHMQYEPGVSAEPTPYVSGYQEEASRPQSYPASSYGQKLVIGHTGSLAISAAQRLALAIISLAFFVFLILLFAVVGIIVQVSTGTFFGALFGILCLYSVVAIVINLVFNRGH